MATNQQLVRAFYSAAIYLIDRVEHDGWYWTTNYLREHARAVSGLQFTNTRSPVIYRLLGEQYPELKPWLALKPLSRPNRVEHADLFERVRQQKAVSEKSFAQ